jgi:alpha/beta superfamily hydrolase
MISNYLYRRSSEMIDHFPKIDITGVKTRPFGSKQNYVVLNTVNGAIEGLFHPSKSRNGILWISGARGGIDGPSFGIFTVLSYKLVTEGITSFRLHYRFPGNFKPCISDVLLGIHFLQERGVDNVVLVGHSFGGAVAIMAGTLSLQVKAVVGLSSQTYGAHQVKKLSPRPLLLIHGERDQNLSVDCSKYIYKNAKEPKELVIYKGCGHFLRECQQELHDLLKSWLINIFSSFN